MSRAIIITGDRNAMREQWWTSVWWNTATGFHSYHDRLIVIHGAAKGIDSIAASIFDEMTYVNTIPMPAQWHTHGKAAGPRRNEEMLHVLMALKRTGYDVAVHAFHDDIESSKGTRDMVNRAIAAGIPVTVHTSTEGPEE